MTSIPAIFRALGRARVRYLLAGGYASVVHGVPRTTLDVDSVNFICDEAILYVTLVSMSDTRVTENVRAGLSRNESLLLSSLSERNKTIFNLKDVTGELSCTYEYAKVLIGNLSKKKWVIPLKRGVYLVVPLSAGARPHYTEHEFVIASNLVSPYYIGYWSALNFHGLTEQTPFTVFVATTKRARNREVLGTRYHFTTLSTRKFFGFEPVSVGPHKINVSNIEKTLADALDHPVYCGGIGEVAKSLWNAREKVGIERVLEYGKKMGNSAILKRLGFLLESLHVDVDPSVLARTRKLISPGISVLDPVSPRSGSYVTRWNLLVNVSQDTMNEWRRDF